MPVDGALTDNAQGLVIYGPTLRTNLYVVQTNPTLAFYHNDPVTMNSSPGLILTPHKGYMNAVDDANIIATAQALLGSVVGIFDENMDTLKYMAVGRTGNSTIAGYLEIADHPQQVWAIQEDAATNAIDLGEGSSNIDLAAATLNAGDTNTGVSACEINSTTAANTSTLNMRLMGPHENDTPANDSYWCRWIVMANFHHFGNAGITAATNTG